jgi:DNA-binding GntR family transcriptional regulator
MADLTAALQHFRDSPRRTAYEAIVATLREAILSGALPPGTRLIQADIATQFGVSNTPVREALRQLTAEDLVRFDSFHGAEVRTPELDEIREVYELSTVLAPLAVRRAVERIDDDELARLRELHESMRRVSDVSEWTQLNREFHDTIDEAAGSARLLRMLSGLRDARMLQVIMAIDAAGPTIDQSNLEHGELLEAIERRDAPRASQINLAHVGASLEAIETQLTETS